MEKINSLSLDLETYSDVDLNKCGVYKYAQSSAFEILLFGVSVNGGEVQVYDLAQGESVLMEIIKALMDISVLKWAFNASFERVCLSVWLQRSLTWPRTAQEAAELTEKQFQYLMLGLNPLDPKIKEVHPKRAL